MENKFDDALKKRLDKYESDIPADMWERITGKDRKRRFVFIPGRLGLLALLLLTGIAGFFYFSPVKNKTNITHEKVIANDILSAPDKSAAGIEDKSNNKNNAIVVNSQIENERLTVKQSEKKELLKKNKKPGKSKVSNKERYPTVQNIKAIEIKSHFTNQSAEDSNSNKPGDATSLSSAKNKKKPAELQKDSLHADEKAKLNGGEDKFSLELFASPELPVNRISSSNKAYEEILKNSANMQLSFNAGVRAKYHISKHLAAKIGVQYTRITSKTNFSDSLASYHFSNNRYINISVPLLITYKISRFSFADLSVNSGILLNVFSRTKGLIPSMNGPVVDLDKGNVYNKNVSATFYISADISKRLQDRTELFMEPWFSYRLKNMTNRNYMFDQRIHGLGLSFGVRYRLFKHEFQ